MSGNGARPVVSQVDLVAGGDGSYRSHGTHGTYFSTERVGEVLQLFLDLRGGELAGAEFFAEGFAVLMAQAVDGDADGGGARADLRGDFFVFTRLRLAR